MFRTIFTILLLSLWATIANAQEWSSADRMQMEAAGQRLSNATTTAERVDALREIEAIAKANPDAPDARILATTFGMKATQEAGPAAMLDALGVLAKSGDIGDVDTYAAIITPMMQTVAEMQENGSLPGSSAIALNDAVQKLDKVAKQAGLPTIGEAISEATGDPALGGAITNTLKRIATAAKLAREAPNLQDMDQAQTRKFIGDMVSILPPGASPAINGPMFTAFTHELAWEKDMFGTTTEGLNLVTDAMETGHLDTAAYNKVREKLEGLSKGPWGSDFAKDALKSLCKSMPVVGKWCDDAFELVEKLVGPSCSAISCDCENVGGGLMRGPLIVQCRMQEETLRAQCEATGTVTGTCDAGAKGPDADY